MVHQQAVHVAVCCPMMKAEQGRFIAISEADSFVWTIWEPCGGDWRRIIDRVRYCPWCGTHLMVKQEEPISA